MCPKKRSTTPGTMLTTLFLFSWLFLQWVPSMMRQLSWLRLNFSGNTQYAGVRLDQIGMGSSHAIISIMCIAICFTIHSNKYKHCLQTTNFGILIIFFSSHSTTHNWCHNRYNHACRWRKWPPEPHMRPCALHQCAKRMSDDPPSKWV